MGKRRSRERGGAAAALLGVVVVAAVLVAGWIWVALSWNYSTGERAGWVQKLSHKGWLCKTWEGEMAMVTMPGTAQEKFLFTVRDDGVAGEINRAMGKRVSLHYEEKVGLPTTCFGETRHYVTKVVAVEEIPLAPGVVLSTPMAPVPAAAPPGGSTAGVPPPSPAAPAAAPAAPAEAPAAAPKAAN
jgi:hypothetical protein